MGLVPGMSQGSGNRVEQGDPDALLDALDQTIARAEGARRELESAIVARDDVIATVHRRGLMGYRRLAERTGLSVPRIQQIIGATTDRPTIGPVVQKCPVCGHDAYAIGINERFCPACGWNWSGE